MPIDKTQSPSRETIKMIDNLVATGSNLFHKPLQENIFFLHFFKCGGTSIARSIKSCYLDLKFGRHIFHLNGGAAKNAAQKIIDDSQFAFEQIDDKYLSWKFREYLLLYHMSQEQTQYIAGHFRFSEAAYQNFADKYAFITVLRDPVERFISSYFYRRYKTGKLDLDFPEYLESESCLGDGSLYVQSLCGANYLEDGTAKEAIALAKMNLHKFKIVGFLEYQAQFLNQFEEQFGRRLKIAVSNKSPKSEAFKKSIVTPEMRAKVAEICQPDAEIYQYAVNNFMK